MNTCLKNYNKEKELMKSKKIKILSGVCSFIAVLNSIFGNVVFAADPPSSRFSSLEDSDDDSSGVPAATAASADVHQSTVSSLEDSDDDSPGVSAAAAAAGETDSGNKENSINDYIKYIQNATEEEIFNEVKSTCALKLYYTEFSYAICKNEKIILRNKVKLLSYFTFVKVLNRIDNYTERIKSQMTWEIYSRCEGFYGEKFSKELICDGKVIEYHSEGGICCRLVDIVVENIRFKNGKLDVFLDAMIFIGGLGCSERFDLFKRYQDFRGQDFENLRRVLEYVSYICGDVCYECGRIFSISPYEPYDYRKDVKYAYTCCDECYKSYCRRCSGKAVLPQ